MNKGKFTRNIIAILLIVMLVPMLLVGCNKQNQAKLPPIEVTTIVYVDETPNPDATVNPDVTVDPNATVPDVTEPTASVDVTPGPTQPPVGGITTPVPTGATKNPATGTTTTTPTKTPTPTKTNAPAVTLTAYKGVAMLGGYNLALMAPFGFSHAWNEGTNDYYGSYINQSWYTMDAFFYKGANAHASKERDKMIRYFELPITGVDVFQNNKYFEYAEKGAVPYMLSHTRSSDKITVDKLPKGLTKVYFDNWTLDKYDDIRNAEGPSTKWMEQVVLPDLKKAIDKVKSKYPNVKIYIGGVVPWDKDMPRHYTKYPDSYFTGTISDDPKDLMRVMRDKDTPAKFKEANAAFKKFAADNGYTFVDFYKTDLVDAQGYRKPEYTFFKDIGEVMSREGYRIYGDTILKAMGLPVAPKLT